MQGDKLLKKESDLFPMLESITFPLLVEGHIGAFASFMTFHHPQPSSSISSSIHPSFLSSTPSSTSSTHQDTETLHPYHSVASSETLEKAASLLVNLEVNAFQESSLFQSTRELALFYIHALPKVALPFASRALQLSHTDHERVISHLTLGEVYLQMGDLQKAFAHFYKSLPNQEALTNYISTSLELGKECEKNGEWLEAVQLYKDTLEKVSFDDPRLVFRLGLAELALGQIENAIVHLESFTKNTELQSTIEPGPAFISLAQAYEKRQEFDKAIDCLSNYLTQPSLSSWTQKEHKTHAAVHLAHLLNRLNRHTEAIHILNQTADFTDSACIQYGIALGTQQFQTYLHHIQSSSPKKVLTFLKSLSATT